MIRTAPTVPPVLSGALDDDDTDFAIDEFSFGLDSVLDGIAARIDRRVARTADRGTVG